MTLVDIDKGLVVIKDMPHLAAYEKWISLLSEDDISLIKQTITDKLDSGEVHTSSFIPGTNWEGTPYYPIYEALKNVEEAGKLFGLLMWETIQEHEETWAVTNYPNSDIKGKVYYKVKVQN